MSIQFGFAELARKMPGRLIPQYVPPLTFNDLGGQSRVPDQLAIKHEDIILKFPKELFQSL